MPSPSSSPTSDPRKDPYQTLGLSHDATAAQIKAAYRRLALRHHPDRLGVLFRRQRQQKAASDGNGNISRKRQEERETQEREEEAQFYRDATDKFSEITTAYGILSDPVKKKEYDHLYKFGAFDDDDDANGATSASAANRANNGNFATAGGYAYTTDFSGGYYRKSPPASSHPNYRRCDSHDSFFDDVLKTPRNDANTSSSFSSDSNQKSRAAPQQSQPQSESQPQSQQPFHQTTHTKSKQKGIGFSLAPIGKHLSIHVPSRHEIVMAMSRGERLHNFGTRVTLTSMESQRIHRQDGRERGNGVNETNRRRGGTLSLFNCANGEEELEHELERNDGNRVDKHINDDGKENVRQSVRNDDYDDDGIRVTDGSGNLYGNAKSGTIPTKNNHKHGISQKQPSSKRRPTRKIVSTTTRFANGTQRVVKRTAYLHSDGTREVVVEENGVERRRYLVDGLSSPEAEGGPDSNPNTLGRKGRDAVTGESDGTNHGKANGTNGRERSWYLNILETCFAPCGGPAMVT